MADESDSVIKESVNLPDFGFAKNHLNRTTFELSHIPSGMMASVHQCNGGHSL